MEAVGGATLTECSGSHAAFAIVVGGCQEPDQSISQDSPSLIWSFPLLPDSCSTEKISKGLNVISERSVSFISFILSLNLLLPFIFFVPLTYNCTSLFHNLTFVLQAF